MEDEQSLKAKLLRAWTAPVNLPPMSEEKRAHTEKMFADKMKQIERQKAYKEHMKKAEEEFKAARR